MPNTFEYGFSEKLSKEFPSQLIIDVSEICNLECVHCPHPSFKKTDYYAGRIISPELNKKAIDEVAKHGKGITQYVRYASDGEPLTHPKIFELLAYAKKHAGTAITLTTNGTLLNSKKIKQLVDTNIDVVDISLDAFSNEAYEKIRVKGDLSITKANVLELINTIRERQSAMKVIVSFVEQAQNQHETADFKAYWESAGAHYVVIRQLHSGAGANETIAVQMKNGLSQAVRRPCVYPWERMVLNPKGILSFCPADWTQGGCLIAYEETSIKALWQSVTYEKLREAHLTNDFSQHSFCGNCPDWKCTQWPGHGRSYATMMEEFKATE